MPETYIRNNVEFTMHDTLAYYKHQFVASDRTLELYFVGCNFECPGCQNQFLWLTNEETRYITPDSICEELTDYVEIAKQVHILGGEPLMQPVKALEELFHKLREMGFKNIILFTGYEFDEKTLKEQSLFKNIDFIKMGRYDRDKPNTEKIPDKNTGIILATTNQRIVPIHA